MRLANQHELTEVERVQLAIEQLVHYALQRGLIQEYDADYSRNRLLELFLLDEPYQNEIHGDLACPLHHLLETLIDYGCKNGLVPEDSVTYRDLLDARIMGHLMARPSEVIRSFRDTERSSGIAAATDAFYKLSVDSNYIRMDRVAENVYWRKETPFGEMEITINLSKPEKNPKEIAMAKLLPPPIYPKCQLCRENVGYAGRLNHPARQNLRIIPLTLNDEPWFFQYSPYVYYNEHSIVFHHDHVPMKLTRDTFKRLLDFVGQFPHYFIGSNADLPIVGGSILTHDHFQAGRHVFPLQKATGQAQFHHPNFSGVSLRPVKWPMSVLRLGCSSPEKLLEAANELYEQWKGYSNPEVGIQAYSEVDGVQVPHNTVTPIVRRRENGEYEMDIVLRNNRTSEEHPEGIFHAHREMHHIKKENIGLIEVMGLAILPGRLKHELAGIASILAGDNELYNKVKQDGVPELITHAAWIEELAAKHGTQLEPKEAEELLRQEVGGIFTEILGHAGVFKQTEEGQRALQLFLTSCGYEKSS
ncbi:UDP-glucose--hexose-1-phosphate uridylyltransferase [Paenibacillus sp. YPG26]|uniref:UDP-glucose--hexose-1-phosphate uridylyltransferase n=1 Tax=Paenibacillus sp. YPG26 TaxID=2878915 RepID=UPI00204103D9|nr:UDP-glucose--hexose-1-phosphate uridylyltransferase [Paenibacillus sp. YPG26]USB34329.1 UDP-glucose--hexose-1-phosphate uridylyltransferase [Paenibacillus sp. YPG26]